MKRAISFLLSFVMVFGVLSGSILTVGAAERYDIIFELSEDEKYYIVKDCDYYTSGAVTIPATYNGKPVKEIAYGAFGSVYEITSVTIPASVTKIEESAFYNCKKLTAINVASANKNFTSVDGVVFNKDKTRLLVFPSGRTGSYTVPSTVTTIGKSAFYTSLLTSVALPKSVKAIEGFAFSTSKLLTTFKGGSGLKIIESYAFNYCESLLSVDLPQNIMDISYSAFSDTPLYENEKNWKDGVFYVDNHIIKFEASRCTGSVTFKSGITYIPKDIISGTDAVKSISIPSTVKTVCDGAFKGCSELKSINFGSGVKTIGEGVASNCKKLTTVKMSGVEAINKSSFMYCPALKTVILSDNLKTVGDYAFYDCDKLSAIKVEGKLESVGRYAFYSTSYYNNEKNWSDGVLYVGSCLLNVKKLRKHSTTLSVKSGTTCIADGAASGERNVEKVTLPSSLKTIGERAFLNCENLKYVNVPETVKTIGKNAFGYKSENKDGKEVLKRLSFNIYGAIGSIAQKYAENNKLNFYNIEKVPKLSTPKLKSVKNTSSGVKVIWGKVTGAKGYYIYRKKGSGSWSRIATVKSGSTLSYTDKKAKSGTTYKYTVRAYYVDFYSSYNTKGLTIKYLSAPYLKSVNTTKNGVTIKWAKSTGADGYYVYRKEGSGEYKKLATVKGNSKVSYLDKNAKKGKTYTYYVKAYSGKSVSTSRKTLKIKDKY